MDKSCLNITAFFAPLSLQINNILKNYVSYATFDLQSKGMKLTAVSMIL